MPNRNIVILFVMCPRQNHGLCPAAPNSQVGERHGCLLQLDSPEDWEVVEMQCVWWIAAKWHGFCTEKHPVPPLTAIGHNITEEKAVTPYGEQQAILSKSRTENSKCIQIYNGEFYECGCVPEFRTTDSSSLVVGMQLSHPHHEVKMQ